MSASPLPAAAPPIPWWRNRRLLPWLLQAGVGLIVLVLVAFLVSNLVRNLTAAGLLL
ncbi:MAG: ABC-type permease for basic amino acid and glutamine, partial [Cyanobacteriota bacterium]